MSKKENFNALLNSRKWLATAALSLALPIGAFANNIQIANATLTGQDTANDYTLVQFDLSWDNSWRTSYLTKNWDAAWVFVKYNIEGTSEWYHASLNDVGHTGGTGATLQVGLLDEGSAFNSTTNPALGTFIYRDSDGSGTLSLTGAQLRWNYGIDGVGDAEVVNIKVFAVEMVYVPEGAFYVGTGGTESGSFTDGSWTSGNTIPLQITSEGALTIGQSAGNLWGTSSTGINTIGGAGSLPAAFPKGFGGFYSMKYEITQQQYVDFLNTLTPAQAANRIDLANTGFRYGITLSSGVYSTTNPYVGCNYLSWSDGAAYADWAGLRPMTELEYEKACRGPKLPVAGEYTWGSTKITQATSISNSGSSNEVAGDTTANAAFGTHDSVQGPMRVGVFAKAATTREQAGASYYGIMELSGNLWERIVTVGNAGGRAFDGTNNGNGTLSSNGHADVATWPGLISGEVTAGSGSGFRGGNWFDSAGFLRASDRIYAADPSTARNSNNGWRGGRSVPSSAGM